METAAKPRPKPRPPGCPPQAPPTLSSCLEIGVQLSTQEQGPPTLHTAYLSPIARPSIHPSIHSSTIHPLSKQPSTHAHSIQSLLPCNSYLIFLGTTFPSHNPPSPPPVPGWSTWAGLTNQGMAFLWPSNGSVSTQVGPIIVDQIFFSYIREGGKQPFSRIWT